jgi:hypothetical protein
MLHFSTRSNGLLQTKKRSLPVISRAMRIRPWKRPEACLGASPRAACSRRVPPPRRGGPRHFPPQPRAVGSEPPPALPGLLPSPPLPLQIIVVIVAPFAPRLGEARHQIIVVNLTSTAAWLAKGTWRPRFLVHLALRAAGHVRAH